MNIFARALGGIVSDKVGGKFGMRGKGLILAGVLLLGRYRLSAFRSCGLVSYSYCSYASFALFLKMSNGATYGIVPFVNAKNVGMVSGIVGAGVTWAVCCSAFCLSRNQLLTCRHSPI
jgi:NNP family nitrate/nitrite transporter-like MFS transporter